MNTIDGTYACPGKRKRLFSGLFFWDRALVSISTPVASHSVYGKAKGSFFHCLYCQPGSKNRNILRKKLNKASASTSE